MTDQNSKPVVTLSHVLMNVIDGGTSYFAYVDDVTEVPTNTMFVSLGDTDNAWWITLHPVEEWETESLRAFSESGYEVELDRTYGYPSWLATDIEDCRWFVDLKE